MLGEAPEQWALTTNPDDPDEEMALVPAVDGVLAIRGRPPVELNLLTAPSASAQIQTQASRGLIEASPPSTMPRRVTHTHTRILEGAPPEFGHNALMEQSSYHWEWENPTILSFTPNEPQNSEEVMKIVGELQVRVAQSEARLGIVEAKTDKLRECAEVLWQKDVVMAEQVLKTQGVVTEQHEKYCQLVRQLNEFASDVKGGNEGLSQVARQMEEILEEHQNIAQRRQEMDRTIQGIQHAHEDLGRAAANFRKEDREVLR